MTDFLQSRDLGDGVMGLTLARGPVNALDPDLLNGFAAILNGFAARDEVRAVVLDSACKAFSAGLDLKEALDMDRAAQKPNSGRVESCLPHSVLLSQAAGRRRERCRDRGRVVLCAGVGLARGRSRGEVRSGRDSRGCRSARWPAGNRPRKRWIPIRCAGCC